MGVRGVFGCGNECCERKGVGQCGRVGAVAYSALHYLRGELASGREDEAARLREAEGSFMRRGVHLGHDLVQHWEEKRSSLARASLRAGHQVAPRESDGDSVPLHRRRPFIPSRLNL